MLITLMGANRLLGSHLFVFSYRSSRFAGKALLLSIIANMCQLAVLLMFLSFCVGLSPIYIKSTENDEEPVYFWLHSP